jgi:hypothetical protein
MDRLAAPPPTSWFQASAVDWSLVPRARIWACAASHVALAVSSAPQMLVSSSQMRLVMMLGLRASCWLAAMTGSLDWKVNSVAGRLPRPPRKLMVGSHVPKSPAPPAPPAPPAATLSLTAASAAAVAVATAVSAAVAMVTSAAASVAAAAASAVTVRVTVCAAAAAPPCCPTTGCLVS